MAHETLEGVHADMAKFIMPAKQLQLGGGDIRVVGMELDKAGLLGVQGRLNLLL